MTCDRTIVSLVKAYADPDGAESVALRSTGSLFAWKEDAEGEAEISGVRFTSAKLSRSNKVYTTGSDNTIERSYSE